MNGFRKGYTPTAMQTAWRRSSRFREISRRTIIAWNARRDELPKCEARRKYDGGVCQNLALENGRCKWHGGRVPKGSGKWHVTQWPAGQKRAEQKTARKLKDGARRARLREKRLAAMTPEEREAHAQWQRTHAATITAGERARRAEIRRRDREAGKSIAAEQTTPSNPEVEAIDRQIAALRRLARERELARAIQNREGIFA